MNRDDEARKRPYKVWSFQFSRKIFIQRLASPQIKDITRQIKKAVVAGNLRELQKKSAEKFGKNFERPKIHLDSDGTEIDDEDYFQTLEPNTELICVFNGEQWIDVRNSHWNV